MVQTHILHPQLLRQQRNDQLIQCLGVVISLICPSRLMLLKPPTQFKHLSERTVLRYGDEFKFPELLPHPLARNDMKGIDLIDTL